MWLDLAGQPISPDIQWEQGQPNNYAENQGADLLGHLSEIKTRINKVYFKKNKIFLRC